MVGTYHLSRIWMVIADIVDGVVEICDSVESLVIVVGGTDQLLVDGDAVGKVPCDLYQ
jgi:hypothetical protein